ncbi:MAG: peptide chain release factor N(5)-glutamine methyltransferase [Betaproteobacteria bacterium]
MTVGEALAASGIDSREARLLLGEAAGLAAAALVAFPERTLAAQATRRFQTFVERRTRGEPVAYILGRKEFYGLELAVTPAVLIPRPETELLVELALERKPASVLDLGTGSGAVALAIKKHLPQARVLAVDSSDAALEVARSNAGELSLGVELRKSRWMAEIEERFELIVANPPYVAEGDPHLADLAYEPRQALVSGADGMDAIREIVRDAPRGLERGGWLLLEHGLGQAEAVRALMSDLGDVQSWPDLAGTPRVSGGKR